jgi:hypothetical protein
MTRILRGVMLEKDGVMFVIEFAENRNKIADRQFQYRSILKYSPPDLWPAHEKRGASG